MILLVWAVSGLGSLASGSICFFLYTHHCLCACETEVQKHGLWWCGPSDGPEVQPDQEIMCVAWIGLFGILVNVGEINEVSFKEGMCIAHQNHLFPSSNDFLLRYYFCLLPTSIKSLRQMVIKNSHIYIDTHKCKPRHCIYIFFL